MSDNDNTFFPAPGNPPAGTDRVDVGPNQFVIDNHQTSYYSSHNPETGWPEFTPVSASPEELKQRDIDGYKRCLESVDHRLEHVVEVFDWEEPLSEAQIERRRAGLEAERAFILENLERLGAIEPAKQGRRKK